MIESDDCVRMLSQTMFRYSFNGTTAIVNTLTTAVVNFHFYRGSLRPLPGHRSTLFCGNTTIVICPRLKLYRDINSYKSDRKTVDAIHFSITKKALFR